jgi:hypothetical protein
MTSARSLHSAGAVFEKEKRKAGSTLPQVTEGQEAEERAETRGKNEGMAEKGSRDTNKTDTAAILALA